MSVNSKMKAIADPLREISGTSALMSLDDMATRAQEASGEMTTQAGLISQIAAALSGKAAGDGETALLQSKTAVPSESPQTITPDTGFDGLSRVEIEAIPEVYVIPSGMVSITENGTHNVREAESVNVSVDAPEPVLQEKSVTPGESAQTIKPDSGYDGLSQVNVGAVPEEYIIPSGTVNITQNGEHDVRNAEKAIVAVDAPTPVLQSKQVTPTAASQTVKPDTGYDGLSQVTVSGDSDLAAENIKSGVSIFGVTGTYEAVDTPADPVLQEKTATPTTSEQTIVPDDGYDGLSKVTVSAMKSAVRATPTISIDSAGLITASVTQDVGYVSAGTKSATKQLDTQAGKTVTPSESEQTAVASGRYTTGDVKVAPIPSQYQDVTTPLAELNEVNGGTAATTMQGAVDNTEEHASSQTNLIAQIASALAGKAAGGSGGGLPTGVSALTAGTYTPTQDYTSRLDVEHGLGVKPNFLIVTMEDDLSGSLLTSALVTGIVFYKKMQYNSSSTIVYSAHIMMEGYNASGVASGSVSRAASEAYFTASTFGIPCNSTYKLKSGYNYHWICGVIDGVA